MKSLSALIEQYKSTPSQVLKDEIFNRVISLEDTTVLDRAESDKVLSDWVIFDSNIRVKNIGNRKYKVADVFCIPGGSYVCYAYIVDLEQYSDEEINGYKSNCINFADQAPDEDSFLLLLLRKHMMQVPRILPFLPRPLRSCRNGIISCKEVRYGGKGLCV